MYQLSQLCESHYPNTSGYPHLDTRSSTTYNQKTKKETKIDPCMSMVW
jgi:hypothetical protein